MVMLVSSLICPYLLGQWPVVKAHFGAWASWGNSKWSRVVINDIIDRCNDAKSITLEYTHNILLLL